MAASSPALSNNSNDTATAAASAAMFRTGSPQKTLRGLNKPKCIQCGNVARSRCPYQSCKSCCSKAQNPCHIHVLKANATFQDKTPNTNTPPLEPKTNDVSPAGNPHRLSSFRQLSNNFAQFNNLQMPLRSRNPLTRKDVTTINEWRFSKLKEYRDGNIEVENESFDRYIQNTSLLEEVFSVKSIMEGSTKDGSSTLDPNSIYVEEDSGMMVSELKLKLRSNHTRSENFRNKMQQIIDRGLKKLKKRELNDDDNELEKSPKKAKLWMSERVSALTDVIDKLNKARTEEDPQSLLKLKSELHDIHKTSDQNETEDAVVSEEQTGKNDWAPRKDSGFVLRPKLFTTTEIDQDALSSVDAHFSSLHSYTMVLSHTLPNQK